MARLGDDHFVDYALAKVAEEQKRMASRAPKPDETARAAKELAAAALNNRCREVLSGTFNI